MDTLFTNIGRCIYCGSTEPPLTREHVLPRGLGGNLSPEGHTEALVLQKATCGSCRKKTQKIEHDCLVPMMDPLRSRLGMKRKDRRSSKSTAFMEFPDGSKETRLVNVDENLGAVAIPHFFDAGVLTGTRVKGNAPYDVRGLMPLPVSPELLNKTTRVGVQITVNVISFAKMLAKIALGIAVMRLGPDGFHPLVQDFILCDPSEPVDYGYWVGGLRPENGEPKTESLYSISLKCSRQAPAGIFHIVEIRLFAEFGGPTNYVVVGEPL